MESDEGNETLKKRPGFEKGHNTYANAVRSKKMKIACGDKTIHPVSRPAYCTILSKGKRRIDEDNLPKFRIEVGAFLQAIKDHPCVA